MATPVEPHDESSHDEIIHLTRTNLWAILISVWVMSVLASGGVAWIAAGISFDHSNSNFSKLLGIERSQAHNGLVALYKADLSRCTSGIANRNTLIANATAQRAFYAKVRELKLGDPRALSLLPQIQVPKKLPPCTVSVPDPTKPQEKLGHATKVGATLTTG